MLHPILLLLRNPPHAHAAPAPFPHTSPAHFAQLFQTAPTHLLAPTSPSGPLPYTSLLPTCTHSHEQSLSPQSHLTFPPNSTSWCCFVPKPQRPSTALLSGMSVLLSSSQAWASCAGRFWGNPVFFQQCCQWHSLPPSHPAPTWGCTLSGAPRIYGVIPSPPTCWDITSTLQAARQHTHCILRDSSTSFVHLGAHGNFLPTGSPNMGQKFHQEFMGAWWSQGEDGVQAHWKTQDLSTTTFNHKQLSQTLYLSSGAGLAASLAAWELGNTKPRRYQCQGRGHHFGCETVPDWLLGFEWLVLQSLFL